MHAHCGCRRLRRLATERPDQREEIAEHARGQRDDWRCPAAGGDGACDDPELLTVAAEWSETTGLPCTGTCPRAGLERAPPLLVQLTSAVALANDPYRVPLTVTLGRELTEADRRCLLAFASARGLATDANDAARARAAELERQNAANRHGQ